MKKDPKTFLYDLLTTPSPTGFEVPVQKVVRDYVKPFADSVETDLHGNVIIGMNTGAKRRVMIAGHCDQIGFMVRHVGDDGCLYLAPLGGIDVGVLQGSRVTVHTTDGPVEGVIGRKPIHLQKPEERSKGATDLDKIWVDIGAKDKKDAERMVSVSDPVTFALGVTELAGGLIASPGLDDKVGLFVAIEALRLCKGRKLSFGLYAVSTVQEEVGLRGARTAAYSIDPEVGIAVDVTHATDNPGGDKTKSAPCVLGGGPAIVRGPVANPVVESLLVKCAKKHKIPYQTSPSSHIIGNDAAAIQVSRRGVASGSIGIPNRYMHTQVEVCKTDDLRHSAELLAHFVASLTPSTSFVPS